jgi:hypothetical protein
MARRILSWRQSNSLSARFSVDCLKEAFEEYGYPEFLVEKGSNLRNGRVFVD